MMQYQAIHDFCKKWLKSQRHATWGVSTIKHMGYVICVTQLVACKTMMPQTDPQAQLSKWRPEVSALKQAESFHSGKSASLELVSKKDARVKKAQAIANKLVEHSFKPGMSVQVLAIKSDQMNSFTAGARYVYVTTALLDNAQSDDELAFILAHEIAHIDLGHGAGVSFTEQEGNASSDTLRSSLKSTRSTISSLAKTFDVLSSSDGSEPKTEYQDKSQAIEENQALDETVDKIGVGADIMTGLNSRAKEIEADVVGFRMAKLANYDPEKGIKFFERLPTSEGVVTKVVGTFAQSLNSTLDAFNSDTQNESEPDTEPSSSTQTQQPPVDLKTIVENDLTKQFTSTHPLNRDRIKNLQRLAQYYKTYEVGVPQPASIIALFEGMTGDKIKTMLLAIESIEQERQVSLSQALEECGLDGLKTAQRELNKLNQPGLRCGVPDGLYGRNTRSCLLAYQREKGLPPSGLFDIHTCGALKTQGIVFR